MPRTRNARAEALAQELPAVFVGEDFETVAPIEEIEDAPLSPAPDPVVEDDAEAEAEERYVLRSRVVDRFNTIRTRVLVTPAVCDVCGTDFVEVNRRKLGIDSEGTYASLSPAQKDDMKALVAEHKRRVHTGADLHIATRGELAKEWLGRR